jgi:membrane protease YdiL (CAAX protease family)
MLLAWLRFPLGNAWFIVFSQAAGIAWTGGWFLVMRAREPVQTAVPPDEVLRITRIMAIAVTAVYLLTWLYEWVAGVPSEEFMRTFFVDKSAMDVTLLLIAVFILAPVGEELAFRYFLFEAMPYRRGGWYAVGSILLVTAAFAAVHLQYQHISTFVSLVLIGAIFACARLFTGRIYPSMLLHALTAVLGLVIQYVQGFN